MSQRRPLTDRLNRASFRLLGGVDVRLRADEHEMVHTPTLLILGGLHIFGDATLTTERFIWQRLTNNPLAALLGCPPWITLDRRFVRAVRMPKPGRMHWLVSPSFHRLVIVDEWGITYMFKVPRHARELWEEAMGEWLPTVRIT